MSAYDTDFATAGLPLLIEQCGVAVTYEDSVVGEVSCDVLFEERSGEIQHVMDGQMQYRAATVRILTSDVTTPRRDATITVSGVAWTVTHVHDIARGVATMTVTRPEMVEKSARKTLRIDRR